MWTFLAFDFIKVRPEAEAHILKALLTSESTCKYKVSILNIKGK
jgi:hypothetical protein